MPSNQTGVFQDCQSVAYQAATKYGIDPRFLYSILIQESGCKPGVISPTGNKGIGQLGDGYIATFCPGTNPYDPIAAIDCAAKGLAKYFGQFGSYALSAAAYHAGPYAVQKSAPCVPGTKDKAFGNTTLSYVKSILARAGIAFDTECDRQATNNTGNTGVVGPGNLPGSTGTQSLPINPVEIGAQFRKYLILGLALILFFAVIGRYRSS